MKVIRLHAGDDVSAAAALLLRFFREEGFDTPDAVIVANTRRMVAVDTCGLFVVLHGEAIGVATVSMEFGIEFGWSAEMGDLYVAPGWRGSGVSHALVGAVEAFLLEKGAKGYQVTVTPEAEARHAMSAYYQKLGFADEGRRLLYKRLA